MADSDNGGETPTSEVGSHEQPPEEKQPPDESSALKILNTMEALLTRMLAAPQPPISAMSAQSSGVQLMQFNPEDADADIEGWCRITELIVNSKRLEGVELLMALTGALRGQAASCLTKLSLNELTWDAIKQSLMARFCRPKLFQDYFDEVLRFQIGAKETASEAGLRLWNMIERIPKTQMPEDVLTGFVISVLCQKDGLIRREINTNAITTKVQLFRILSGITLKRRLDHSDTEPDFKRPRMMDAKFSGKCHWCGIPGHRLAECRKRREDYSATSKQLNVSSPMRAPERTSTVTCFICGSPGHIATNCQEKRSSGAAPTRKEVNICEQQLSRGTLRMLSGESIPFLFDSGSSCSLIKESIASKFQGTVRNDLVYLTGIGGDTLKCTSQILSEVNIGDITQTLLFHIIPDSCLSDSVIVGRDVLENGVSVKIDNDN